MKLACLIILILLNLVDSEYITVDQMCREQEGASEQDTLYMRDHRAPETRVQKCYFDCVYREAGYSDGKRFLKESFLRRLNEHAGNDEAMKAEVRQIAERCDGLENEDRCELAAEIDDCIRDR